MDYQTLIATVELVIRSLLDKIEAAERRLQTIRSNQYRIFDDHLYRSPDGKRWTVGKSKSDETGSIHILRYDLYDPNQRPIVRAISAFIPFVTSTGSISSLPEGSEKASDPNRHVWAWRDPLPGEIPGKELNIETCNLATLRGELENIQQFQNVFLRHHLEVSSVLSRSNDVNWSFNLLVWMTGKVVIRDSVQLRIHEALDRLRNQVKRIT